VYTSEETVEVGVRQLRNELSRWLALAREGQEVVITERGRPVARLVGVSATGGLDRLVEAGLVQLPRVKRRSARTIERVRAKGSVADLVAEQRR
jgi:prevent-host-death family protein